MTATATHDTKRGEDARMRLLALSELAQEWGQAVRGWSSMNVPLIEQQGRRRAPSRAHEYMLYQAIAGAWPLGGRDNDFLERMQTYALKAAREGKQETSWANPDEAYEKALTGFLAKLLDDAQSREFLADFDKFVQRLSLLGALNSLSQLALKATIPGVPDFYQGTELWDLSLVDPDNRRPVDFAARERLLQNSNEQPTGDWRDGQFKFALTRRLLALRKDLPALFAHGSYEPIAVEGEHRDHVIAFARRHGHHAVIVAVGRRFSALTDAGQHWPRGEDWDATLALDGYRVTGSALDGTSDLSGRLAAHFTTAPVAVLLADIR